MVAFDPAEDYFSSILGELQELRGTGALCDATLTIGQAQLPAHRCVLAAGSHYFRTLFLGQFKESSVPNIDVPLSHVTDDFKALELVVDFLYTGKIEIDDDNLEVIVKLSTFLLIDRLTDNCMDYIYDHMNLGTWLDRYLFAIEHGLTEIESKGVCIVGSRFHDYFILEDNLDLCPDEVLLLWRNGIFQHCTVYDMLLFVFKWLKDKATDRHFIAVSQLLDNLDLKSFDCLPEDLKCGIKDVLSDLGNVSLKNSSEMEKTLEKLKTILKELLPKLQTAREHCEVKLGQSDSSSSSSASDHEEVIVSLSPRQCIVDAFECRDGFLSYPMFNEPIFTLSCYKPSSRTWFHIQDFEAEQAIADLPKNLGYSHTIVPALLKEELVLVCNDDSSNDMHPCVKVYFYNIRSKTWRSHSTPIRVYNSQHSDQRRCVQDYCVINGNDCLYLIFKVMEFDERWFHRSFEPNGEFFLGCSLEGDGTLRKVFETQIERNHASLNSEIQAKFSSVNKELIFTSGHKVDTEDNQSEGFGEVDSERSVRGYNYVFVVNLSEAAPTIETLSKVRAKDSGPPLTGVNILQTPSHFYIVYDGTAQSRDRDVRIVYEYKLGSLSLTQPQEDTLDCLIINQHYGPEEETFPCCEELAISNGKTLWAFDGDANFFSNLYEVQIEEGERPTCKEDKPRSTHEKDSPMSTIEQDKPRSKLEEDTPRATSVEATPGSSHEESTQKPTLEEDTPRPSHEEHKPRSTSGEEAPRCTSEEDKSKSKTEQSKPPLQFMYEVHTPPPFSCMTRMAFGELPADLIAQMKPITRFLHNHCKTFDNYDETGQHPQSPK